MNFRSSAVLLVLPTLIGGLLISTPAAAAPKQYSTVTTSSVAINSNGLGRVYLRCSASSTCKGKVSIAGGVETKYAVAAKKAAYVFVTVPASANPNSGGTNMGDYFKKESTLTVNEDSPSNVTHAPQNITTETKVASQEIAGTVKARPGSPIADDVEIELWRIGRGGVTQFIKSDEVSNNGSFSHSVSLGTNNSPSGEYGFRVTGIDDKGEFQSWWWRGGDDAPRGGGKYIREATRIKATKSGEFTADVQYASISGTVRDGGTARSNVEVTVAGAPSSYSDARTNKDLDFPGCANNFGQQRTNGAGYYEIGFLPYSDTDDPRYAVLANPRSISASTSLLPLWNDEYGSCLNAMGYAQSRANLISLTSGNKTQHFALRESKNKIHVNAGYSGFTPTEKGDRFVRVREKIPGVGILDSPVIKQTIASTGGVADFSNLPRGSYWVEVGRRTGCSAWYKSRYKNNNLYFNGEDRGAERWKAQNYRMYREYCKAIGAGSYSAVSFSGNDVLTVRDVTPTIKKGATVRGHVKRGGGRTNKEMLIRIYSTGEHARHEDRTDRRRRQLQGLRTRERQLPDLGQRRLVARHHAPLQWTPHDLGDSRPELQRRDPRIPELGRQGDTD